jgi:hypothetical protein
VRDRRLDRGATSAFEISLTLKISTLRGDLPLAANRGDHNEDVQGLFMQVFSIYEKRAGNWQESAPEIQRYVQVAAGKNLTEVANLRVVVG